MLRDASAINDYAIEASDGPAGTVSDFLFEDVGWVVRWLVVDTGNGLSGREALLPLSALGRPDWALRHFSVRLTMRHVKDSPDVDTDQPVSRQIEAHIYDYFGWNPYWRGSFLPMSNAKATPFVAPLYEQQSTSSDLAGADAQSNEDDQHVRSIATVTGYHVHAIDGEIGREGDSNERGKGETQRARSHPGRRALNDPRWNHAARTCTGRTGASGAARR